MHETLYLKVLIKKCFLSVRIVVIMNNNDIARMEEGRSAFEILTGKPTGKRPLGKPRCRWEDDITMDLKEICINTRIGIIGEPL